MIDILFLAYKRREFTAASLRALLFHTDWRQARLIVYTDGDEFRGAVSIEVRRARHGGPVAIMNDYLRRSPSAVFAKIDNDTIVPPGWLERAAQVMSGCPEVELLGIEPPQSRTPAPGCRETLPPESKCSPGCSGWVRCDSIGGIGLMRSSAFRGKREMRPHGLNGVGGFTDWQLAHPEVVKGWILPPLNVFLLDRLPTEPWVSLSKRYIAEGVQRPWTNYAESHSSLWSWWEGAKHDDSQVHEAMC